MESKILTGLLVLIGCFYMIQAFRQPKCRGKETKLSEEELNTMTECIKEFAGTDGKNFKRITKDRMGCVGKCVLQRSGLIDEKGVPMKDNIFAMVNATMEPEVAAKADEMMGKCIDEKSDGIDMSEGACSTYWPLVECVAASFMQICQISPNSTQTEAP